MEKLVFQIKGLKTAERKRFRRHSGKNGGSAKGLLHWLVVVAVVLMVFGDFFVMTVDLGGVRITAREVLLLIDTSGSMGGYQGLTKKAKARLVNEGFTKVNQVNTGGSSDDLLGKITAELQNWPRVDAIWIVGDFQDGSDLVNGDDKQRYNRLVNLLRQKRIKLYLSTVEKKPPPDHIQAARVSGGTWGRFQSDPGKSLN